MFCNKVSLNSYFWELTSIVSNFISQWKTCFYFGIILQVKILKGQCFSLLMHKLQIETCRKVENVLKRFDRKETRVQVLPFHAAMTQELRLANMEKFIDSPSKEVSQFLVCTDRYTICLTQYFWVVENFNLNIGLF